MNLMMIIIFTEITAVMVRMITISVMIKRIMIYSNGKKLIIKNEK